MHSAKESCIFPAMLIGAAVGFFHYEKMKHRNVSVMSSFEPMMIFPKGMEKKAKAFVKEARHLWNEIM